MSIILYQETAEPILPAEAPLVVAPYLYMPEPVTFFDPPFFDPDLYNVPATILALSNVIFPFTGNKLVAPILLAETWADHFGTRNWTNILAQVNAGYPVYAQPVPQRGSYKEVIDYGAVFSNVIVNVDWGTAIVFGTVNVTCETRYSLDGLSWSSPVIGTSTFVPSMRYLEVTIKFEAVN